MAEFDPNHLESLMVAAFELLGKPEGQAQEMALVRMARSGHIS
jgi:hypothetical protein